MIYPIEIIREKVNKEYLEKFLDKPFKEVVKFVVDIEKELIAFGGELHSDAQQLLINNGSDSRNLWGGSIFLPEHGNEITIDYSALINIKPSQNNPLMDIRDKTIIEKIDKALKKTISDL